MERIQKVIAQSGVCSRRKAETLIVEGRVTLNGKTVTELGIKVGKTADITVDGIPIKKQNKVYFLLNKPTGYLSTVNDPKGRKTVIDLLTYQDSEFRVYPVGRLDYDTAGALLLTNDGDFADHIMSPKSGIEKEYIARIEGLISKEDLKTLASGVVIDGYKTKRCQAYLQSTDNKHKSSSVSIILKEGKNQQVRKMFEVIGYQVKKLTRLRIGQLTLEGIARGEYRELKVHEIRVLMAKHHQD